MSQLSILISGAGIAGPALAYWLAKSPLDVSITVIERSPEPRTTGQAVDIRGPAVEVIRKMGLEETIRSKHTQEQGIAFVDSSGDIQAQFDASGDTEKQSATSEFEILRADLAKVFIDAVKDVSDVKFIYGHKITALKQSDSSVEVEFSGDISNGTYDLIVAADGMTSPTRSLIFGEQINDDSMYNFLGQYIAFFSLPRVPSDKPLWLVFNEPGGRSISLRPHPNDQTVGAYLIVTTPNKDRNAEIDEALGKGVNSQKSVLREYFNDAGWQAERILDGMDQASDFYMQQISQVKLPKWSKGRAVVLGDTAYCPTPISGQGTSVAILGAYVFAGELSKALNPGGDVTLGLEQYEKVLRPLVEKCQILPPGVPQIANPQSQLGINVRDTLLKFLAWSKVDKLLGGLGDVPEKDWKLPEYEWKT